MRFASMASIAGWRCNSRPVEFVLVDFARAKHLAQARSRGGGRQGAGGSQFGCRIENAPDQKGKDEITVTVAVRAEDTVKANPAGGAESGRDVAVRQTANDGEGFTLGWDDGATLENPAKTFDVGRRPV
jgi:hypothetical protein